MQIIGIKIKNFLSLTDVEIKPGQITQIVGGNNQGKTSIIKALQFAAFGSTDSSLVRQGADEAEVIVEFDEGTIARRRISSEGKQAVYVIRDDMKSSSPQTFLDNIFKTTAFNPLEVLNSKNRTETILKSIDLKLDRARVMKLLEAPSEDVLPDVDYTQHGLKVLEQLHTYYYARRTEANRELAEKRNRFEAYKKDLTPLPILPGLDRDTLRSKIQDEDENRGHVKAKLSGIADMCNFIDKKKADLMTMAKQYQKLGSEKLELEMQLKVLEERMENGNAKIDEAQKELYDLQSKLPDGAALNQELVDIETRIGTYKLDLQKLALYEEAAKAHDKVGELKAEYSNAEFVADVLDGRVKQIRGDLTSKVVSSIKMPIDGLKYRDGEFFLDEIPIQNLSSSKSIKLAVAIARKLSSKLKVICLDGAEQLDPYAFEELKLEIENDGFTYFLTKVGEAFPNAGNVVTMKSGEAIQ